MSGIDPRALVPRLLAALALVAALGALALAILGGRSGSSVLVLASDVARGDPFGPASVKTVRAPDGLVPADALPTDSPLPAKWPGEPASAGTILSESVLAGSALGRSLRPEEALITVMFDRSRIPPLEAGDSVELRSPSGDYDLNGCVGASSTSRARISSISVSDAPAWESSASARLDLIVDAADIESVLGHSGAGTLSLALISSRTE